MKNFIQSFKNICKNLVGGGQYRLVGGAIPPHASMVATVLMSIVDWWSILIASRQCGVHITTRSSTKDTYLDWKDGKWVTKYKSNQNYRFSKQYSIYLTWYQEKIEKFNIWWIKQLNYCIKSNRLITGTKNDQAWLFKEYHTKSKLMTNEHEINTRKRNRI